MQFLIFSLGVYHHAQCILTFESTVMARLSIAFGFILFLIGCTKNSVSSRFQITGFNPMNGPVDTTVVISGYHFSSDITQDIVIFNGVRAKVKSATSKQLVVTVPPLATTGNITVSVDTSVATSEQVFTVATNRWSFLTDYPGTAMGDMAFFQIGDNIYMGIGYVNSIGGNSGEFWQYNIPSDQWTRKANFPKVVPGQAFGFAVGGKGYVIVDMETVMPNPPVYEYDPASDAWTLIGEFPQIDFDATMTTFTIGNYAYAGLTNNGNLNDHKKMFRFDPTVNLWTPIADYPGNGFEFTASFVIGNYAYVGTGTIGLLFEGAADYHKDFYQYDPSSDAWTRKADLAGQARCFSVGFSIGNYGYIGSGIGSAYGGLSDFWRYDPSTDSWSQIADYGDRNHRSAIAFSGAQFGYAGFVNGNPDQNTDDQQPQLWIYHPQE
jgi:N-acetylneuraminic acid mutarotase